MNKILKPGIAYAFGSALNSAALFVLIPFLVRAFPTNEYGAWTLLEIGLLILIVILSAGIEVGMMREYWHLEDEDERRRLFGTTIVTATGWSITAGMTLGVVFLFAPVQALLPPEISVVAVWVVLAIAICDVLANLGLTVLRIREEAVRFVLLSSGRLLLLVFLTIGGLALRGDLIGALLGRLAAAMINMIVTYVLIRRYIKPAWNLAILRRIIPYSLPLIPSSIASYILLVSDRWVLQAVAGLEAVAIYTFAYKIATVVDILVTRPFATDWAPRRFKIAAGATPQTVFAQFLPLYLYLAGSVTMLIIAGIPLVYTIIAPPEYYSGAAVIPIILLAYIIYGAGYPLNVGIMLKNKTQYLLFISFASVIVCLGLNFWLIPRFGYYGAAWATVCANLVWTGTIALLSLRLYPIPYHVRDITVFFIGMLIAWFGLDYVGTAHTIWITTVLRVVWVVVVCGITGIILFRIRLSRWIGFRRRVDQFE